MNDLRKSGGVLAAIIAIVAMILFCLAVAGGVLGYRSYLAQKQAVRVRAIKVWKQIEAREAQRRDSELSAGAADNP